MEDKGHCLASSLLIYLTNSKEQERVNKISQKPCPWYNLKTENDQTSK